MSPFRMLALSSLLLSGACSKDAPANDAAKANADAKAEVKKTPGSVPKNVLPPGDPHATPAPNEPTAQPPLMASAAGHFDVKLGDRLSHFLRLPRGQNRAIAFPDKDLARVSIAAAKDSGGWPHIRFTLEGVRPDQLEYPKTFDSKDNEEGGPTLKVRYQMSEQRIYEVDTTKDANMTLTLEAYEGHSLRGKFEGKLAPQAAGLGDPIPLSGDFSVELGLRGVEPGPTPEGTQPKEGAADTPPAEEAKAPDAKAEAKAPQPQPPL